jgi:hypothetical protein
MRYQNHASSFGLCWLFILSFMPVTSVSANDSEIVEKLRGCAQIAIDDERSSCYEELGKSVLENEVELNLKTVNEAQVIQSSTKEDKLPDSLGGGQFAEKAGVKVETNRGHVTSCKKASDRKWFYIFESGQVWKQVDSRKRRHKDCNFMVTIVKDAFGYKMHIDGQDTKIRIDRRQ